MENDALEKACGADIVGRKIDLLNRVIGDKQGSGEPAYVILQAQRDILKEVWIEMMRPRE